MNILTLEQLLELHALVIQNTGGSEGLRDLGRLEAAIATQSQNVFGEELYSTAVEKTAALIRSLIADHPFIDGNKRTAMLAGLTFLDMNNYRFKAKPGEIEDFAVQVAIQKMDVKEVTKWLQAHINN